MNWGVVAFDATPALLANVREVTGVTTIDRFDRSADLHPASGVDGIVVVGSDADLARVGWAMHREAHRVPLMLVPTAPSDLLRMFALQHSDLARRIAHGQRYPCDLGLCRLTDQSARPFIAHVEAHPGRGGSRLGPSAALDIDTGRRGFEGSAWRVLAINAQHVSGAGVGPRAAVMDGLLDVQVFGGPWLGRSRLLRQAAAGLHLKSPDVWRRQTARVSVDTPASWPVLVDGVGVGRGPFSAEVLPAAVDLWV